MTNTRGRRRPSDKELAVLVEQHGRDFETIAKICKIATSTVYSYISAAGLLSRSHRRDKDMPLVCVSVEWRECPLAKRYGYVAPPSNPIFLEK